MTSGSLSRGAVGRRRPARTARWIRSLAIGATMLAVARGSSRGTTPTNSKWSRTPTGGPKTPRAPKPQPNPPRRQDGQLQKRRRRRPRPRPRRPGEPRPPHRPSVIARAQTTSPGRARSPRWPATRSPATRARWPCCWGSAPRESRTRSNRKDHAPGAGGLARPRRVGSVCGRVAARRVQPRWPRITTVAEEIVHLWEVEDQHRTRS